MYKALKLTSAHLGVVFVFFGIAIAPASLKVTGLVSTLSGAAQTWKQVANVFGATYQPVDAVELSALNGDVQSAPAADPGTDESVCEQSLVASLIENRDSEIDEDRVADQKPARCESEKSKPVVNLKKRVEPVMLPVTTFSAATSEVRSFRVSTTTKADLIVKVISEQLEEQRIELGETLKALKVLKSSDINFKFKVPAAATPKVAPCKARPALTPEQRDALRVRAAAISIADMAPWGPENTEF